MAQWVNRFWNISINPPPSLLCEICGALHLVQPGLMADWLAGRQNSGEFQKFLNSLQLDIFDISLRLTSVQHHYSSTNAFL